MKHLTENIVILVMQMLHFNKLKKQKKSEIQKK